MARMSKEELTNKKYLAKIIYTKEKGVSQKEIASRVGVSEKTIGKWIKEEKWENLKKNIILTRQEQHAALIEELERLNIHVQSLPLGFADSKLADTRRKLVKDIKELETEDVGVAETISVQIGFLEFVRKIKHEDALILADYSDAFIKSKL